MRLQELPDDARVGVDRRLCPARKVQARQPVVIVRRSLRVDRHPVNVEGVPDGSPTGARVALWWEGDGRVSAVDCPEEELAGTTGAECDVRSGRVDGH